jgi:hypothetical protein
MAVRILALDGEIMGNGPVRRDARLRPIIALAALHFGELINQRPPAAVQVVHDCLALRVEAQAGFAPAYPC